MKKLFIALTLTCSLFHTNTQCASSQNLKDSWSGAQSPATTLDLELIQEVNGNQPQFIKIQELINKGANPYADDQFGKNAHNYAQEKMSQQGDEVYEEIIQLFEKNDMDTD